MKKCLRVWYGMMGLMLVAMEIQACRYSIRDVSFVDLEPVPYQFFWLGGEAGARDEDVRRQLSAAATALLSDANLQFSSQLPPESVRDKWQGKPLILVAPDGRSLGMEMESGTSDLDGWAMKTVRSLISSDLRRSILDAAIENYALVILVDGLDAAENQRAAEAARNALDEVGKLLPRMPKPVDRGPEMIRLPERLRQSEEVALWSLGLDIHSSDVQAVVVSGRGRRVGPALTGGLVTRTALQEHLVIVGQDCECELDRSWMQGPMIPASWDQALRQKTFASLGFDTENPVVKSEMSRIMARGPNATGNQGSGSFQPASGFNDLLMGYQEIEVIDNDMDPIMEDASGSDSGGELVYQSGMTQAQNDPAPAYPQDETRIVPSGTAGPLPSEMATSTRIEESEIGDAPVLPYILSGLFIFGVLVVGFFILTAHRPAS